jgi:hypothetical protein
VRVFELGHGAKIAGLQLRHMRLSLALKCQKVTEALGRFTRRVVHRGI